MKRPAQQSDEGFTLIELLLSVAILIVVLGSLSGALIVFLKNGPEALDRDDHSAGAALTASYIDRDVASTEELPASSQCSLPAGGARVLALAWYDYATVSSGAEDEVEPVRSTRYDRLYAVVPGPVGEGSRLVRVACSSVGAPSTTTLLTDIAAGSVTASSTPGVCPTVPGPSSRTAITLTVGAFRDDSSDAYTFSGCAKTRLSS